MRRNATLVVSLAVLAVAPWLAGCSDRPGSGSLLAPDPAATLRQSEGDIASGRSRVRHVEPEDFVRRVDHAFFPLTPGTVYRYAANTEEGLETIVVRVERGAKRILGVATTVVHDQVLLDGQLIEDTFDWFAQDEDGNVWYFGEDTKDYENGVLVGTEGSWIAGQAGARPGFMMLARPRIGKSYQQEVAPGVAEDRAVIVGLDETVTVPFGTFRGCLKTYETTPLDPTSREFKYYARGIGHVLTVRLSDGLRTELVSVARR